MLFLLENLSNLSPNLTKLINAGSLDALTGMLAGMLAGMFVLFIILGIILYIYKAWAWFTIGKKLGYKKSWLAWIPVAQFFVFPILAGYNWAWGFIILLPLVMSFLLPIPIIGEILFVLSIIFVAVMYFIWVWKIYEKRKYSGWLSLIPVLSIIPIIGFLAGIAQLVVMGFVAWHDKK